MLNQIEVNDRKELIEFKEKIEKNSIKNKNKV